VEALPEEVRLLVGREQSWMGKVAISIWAENIVVPPSETVYIRFPTADVEEVTQVENVA
jgi:hypothetical protein